MIAKLQGELRLLLQESLPDLFAGDPPAVAFIINTVHYDVDKYTAAATVSEPKPLNRVDTFAYNADDPPQSFTLSQPPYPGPVRIYLTTADGDRIPLSEPEIIWHELDSQQFSLKLAAHREVDNVTGIRVLYGVIAVHTTIKLVNDIEVALSATDALLVEQAAALAMSTIHLNLGPLLDKVTSTYSSGDYSAITTIKSMKLIEGNMAPGTEGDDFLHAITYQVEMELLAQRALRQTEGLPIERIRTTGRPLDPARPVDIHIDVEA